MSLRSAINAEVPLAAPGEFLPLRLSETICVWPPVVLAPMAGVTNPPYRTLCRRRGAGLYVAEMLHARGLTERAAGVVARAAFDPEEPVRSVQIFGCVPQEMHAAARFLVEEVGVQHVDVNMGCPVPKVTSRGGGSALPARPRLMRQVLAAVVAGARGVPVTVKTRLGLDEKRFTWRDAVDAAAGEGAAWIGVHARTAAQHYSGHARWELLGEIKAVSPIPVLGNGDVWEAFDALRLLRTTGCDGVIVGRGCLGRPWLFSELAAVFDGKEPDDPPRLGEVLALLIEHARLLVEHFGEAKGCLEVRKWCTWYTKGFDGSARVRQVLQHITSLEELSRVIAVLDPAVPFPEAALRVPRGKSSGGRAEVLLPAGWLDLGAREAIEQRAPRAAAASAPS